MLEKINTVVSNIDKPTRCGREVLVEQILWLIKLRWIAAVGIIIAALIGNFVFPVLITTTPIYACALLLLLCNTFYYCSATKKPAEAGVRDTVLAIIQIEADLAILTAILYFAGGAVNPFFLFYIFHVIIATIILPRNLSYVVGITTIVLFGLLAVNELNGGTWLPTYPLQLSAESSLWRNPVFVLAAFAAFSFTVVLTQYLTRIIISRMRSKELEAARNKDMLEAVINAMTEGLIFVTSDGHMTICNPAAKLWKINGKQKTSRGFDDFPPELAKHINDLVVGDGKPSDAEQIIEFTTAGQQPRYIQAASCAVVSVDGQKLGYVILGQDLTEHKNLEKDLIERTEDITAINEMLKMSRIEMAQREKMVAIGQMATGIAHEIGNPLASLSSVTQYLGRKLKNHEEKEHLLVMEGQIDRISNILKRMLSLSRPATANYKWVDINELINKTLSLIKFDKRMNSVTIESIDSPDLPMVWLNPQSFEQVLLNVFINAMDAMDTKKSDKHILKITREFKDKMVEIRVADTGIGMSPEVCDRAFKSFFTTKDIGKGTGLGLFISYNLVAEVDGTITLESEPEKGTTVIIRIPVRPKKDLITDENTKESEAADVSR